MIYLFLGTQREVKEKKISELKEKILTTHDARQFDYELLYGNKLDPQTLKKSLLNLPAVAAKRLVVIREGHQLSPQNKEILTEFLAQQHNHVEIILDSDEWTEGDSFVKKIKPFAKVFLFAEGEKPNVFDMGRTIMMKRPVESLEILSGLLSSGNHPLQIMGGLVWFWGKSRDKVTPTQFSDGLNALAQADLNIKRSRLRPEYALELLVVKLCSR